MVVVSLVRESLQNPRNNSGLGILICPRRIEVSTWNPKHPFINGCFNWMIPNLCIGNGCFNKHPINNGCLGFQVGFNR